MSGGGKGSSQSSTTRVRLDPRIETAGAEAAAAGLRTAALPYRANRGVTVAGFSPQQRAAFEGANEAAMAFGLPSVAGVPGAPVTGDYIPEPETAAGGFQGYSLAPVMDENIELSTDPEYRSAVQRLLKSYAEAADRVSPMGGAKVSAKTAEKIRKRGGIVPGKEESFANLLTAMPLFNSPNLS